MQVNNRAQQVFFALRSFWRWLTEPSAHVPEGQRRQVQLLSTLLITLMPVGTMGYFAAVLFDPLFTFQPISFSAMFVFWTAYFLSRSRYHLLSIFLVLLGATAPIYGLILTGNADQAMLPFLIIGIILSSILVPAPATIGYVLINILCIVGLNMAVGTPITFGLLYFVTASLLLLVLARHRDLLEADRQAALAAAKANLEVQVLERTDQLSKTNQQLTLEVAQRKQAETELERARDQALEASQLKSQFLANMSHELRTPLNAILNFSEFVATGALGPVNPEQVKALQKVVESGDHLLSLINDILDLTKIEAGLVELFIEDVNLQELFSASVDTARGLIKEKSVELIIHVDEDLPTIRADKRRIRQILLNVIANAIKFTEAGSVTIDAHVQNGEVLFTVKDTGPGIPQDEQKLVLEAFRQGRVGIKQSSGTGLGLPISKRLAEAHQGRLWFESVVGSGSIFYIALPINSQKVEAVASLGKDANG